MPHALEKLMTNHPETPSPTVAPPSRTPSPTWWPGPKEPAAPVVFLASAMAGLAAAIVLPLDRPGLGWFLTALVAAAAVSAVARCSPGVTSPTSTRLMRMSWVFVALALMGVGTVRAASWLFTLCVLTACAAGSMAVTEGRSIRKLPFDAVAVPVAAMRAVPWLGRGLAAVRRKAGGGSARLAGSVLMGIALVAVFGALFAGADATFAGILSAALPTVDGGSVVRWIFLFGLAGVGTAGACFLLAAPPGLAAASSGPRTSLRRVEWALPVGLLVVLFTSFVVVQLVALFGGNAYVLRTTGLTYAEYARGGFWQLSVVTLLTLAVIATAARWAATTSVADRALLRGLLGALAVLTLVIVASALRRMWSYQQAYGFTVLRLLVETCELWLGLIFLLVIAAGVRLRTGWLPRTITATGMAALLALAALNPDRFIAERSILRWEQTGRIDVYYLNGLSADAAQALTRLPEPLRSCALAGLPDQLGRDGGDWRSWNASRSSAREVLAHLDRPPVRSFGC
jgi:hypothetical protein